MRRAEVQVVKRRLALVLALLGFGGAALLTVLPTALAAGDHVALVEIDEMIAPSTARFLSRAVDKATNDDAHVLIVRLDTPGGLIEPTRKMVEAILASPVPVVVFVAPEGAHAASAGTFITAAAHVAAMAPTTNIGAASPVVDGADLPLTRDFQATRDAAAFLRSIAERRGRDAEALELTVMRSAAYSATEALERGIIDLIATDLDDLRAKLDGRTVQLASGEVVLDTFGLEVRNIEKTVLESFLGFLTSPTMVFLLLTLGGFGVFIEVILGGGLIFPGLIGVVFLALAFVAKGDMPVNWAGVALVGVAMAFFYFEAAVMPGTTVFGVLGVISVALGGLLLFGDFALPGFSPQPIEAPGLRVDPWTTGGIAAAMFGLVMFVVRDMMASRKSAAGGQALSPELVGERPVAVTVLAPRGTVHVGGEDWSAESDSGEPIQEGEEVIVSEAEGLMLRVSKASATPE